MEDEKLIVWEPTSLIESEDFGSELRAELAPSHPLHGQDIRVVARRLDQDDVLLSLPDSRRWAICHLTWSGKQEPPNYPRTKIYDDLADLLAAANS